MDGIVAVAFLVGCASNLLICQDLPARPDRFADIKLVGQLCPRCSGIMKDRKARRRWSWASAA